MTCIHVHSSFCAPQVAQAQGRSHAGGHAAFGLLLLGNVAFNYAACVRTPPGTTDDLSIEVRDLCCVRSTVKVVAHTAWRCPAPVPTYPQRCMPFCCALAWLLLGRAYLGTRFPYHRHAHLLLC